MTKCFLIALCVVAVVNKRFVERRSLVYRLVNVAWTRAVAAVSAAAAGAVAEAWRPSMILSYEDCTDVNAVVVAVLCACVYVVLCGCCLLVLCGRK